MKGSQSHFGFKISDRVSRVLLTTFAIYIATTLVLIPLSIYVFVFAKLSSDTDPVYGSTAYLEFVLVGLTVLWIYGAKRIKENLLQSYVEIIIFSTISACLFSWFKQEFTFPFSDNFLIGYPLIYLTALVGSTFLFFGGDYLLRIWTVTRNFLRRASGLFSNVNLSSFLTRYSLIFLIGIAFSSIIAVLLDLTIFVLPEVSAFDTDSIVIIIQLVPIIFSPFIYSALFLYSLKRKSLRTNLNLISIIVSEAYLYILLLIFPIYSICVYLFSNDTRVILNAGILGALLTLLLIIGLGSYFNPEEYLGPEGHLRKRLLIKRTKLLSKESYILQDIDKEIAELYVRQYLGAIIYVFIATAITTSFLGSWSVATILDLVLILIIGVAIFYRVTWIAIAFLPYFLLGHILSALQSNFTLAQALKNPVLFIYLLLLMYRGMLGVVRLNQLKNTSLSMSDSPQQKATIAYVFGGLAFIPLVGVIFGIVAIVIGILKKVRGPIYLGVAGILVTVCIYGALFYFGSVAKTGPYADLKVQLTSQIINADAGQVSLYKQQHGVYPDSLQQLASTTSGSSTSPTDPWFNELKYATSSTGFTLSSAGLDEQFGTDDDISQTF